MMSRNHQVDVFGHFALGAKERRKALIRNQVRIASAINATSRSSASGFMLGLGLGFPGAVRDRPSAPRWHSTSTSQRSICASKDQLDCAGRRIGIRSKRIARRDRISSLYCRSMPVALTLETWPKCRGRAATLEAAMALAIRCQFPDETIDAQHKLLARRPDNRYRRPSAPHPADAPKGSADLPHQVR